MDEVIDGVEIGEITVENETADSTIEIGDYAKHAFKLKKPWLDKGIDVHEDSVQGPMLAYVSYQNRDKDGHAHFDIAVSDTNKNSVSVTYLADAVYPAIDAQGTTVIFAMREPYSTRFKLAKVPYPKNIKDYTSEDPVDLFVPDSKFNGPVQMISSTVKSSPKSIASPDSASIRPINEGTSNPK